MTTLCLKFGVFLCVVWIVRGQTPASDIPKTTIRVTTIPIKPFLMKQGQSKTDYSGFIPELLETLSRKIGFKYKIHLVKDMRYGSLHPRSNEWDGMIGELLRGEADMAAAPMTITSTRERVVDFSKPFMTSGIGMVVSKRIGMPRRSRTLFHLLQPVSSEVWFILILSFFVVWLTCILLRKFHPDEQKLGEELSFRDAVVIETKAIVSKNSRPRSCARGVILGSAYLLWLSIFVIYCINLINYMSYWTPPTPLFSSAADVFSQSRVPFGALEGGSTMAFFRTSQVPIYKKAYERMQANPHWLSNSTRQGIQRTRDSVYIFIGEASSLPVDSPPCDLMQIGGLLTSTGYGFAFRINYKLRHYVDLALLELKENGHLHALYNKWWKRGSYSECEPVEKEPKQLHTEVGLRYVYLPIVVFVIGLGIAAVLVLFNVVGKKLFGNKVTKRKDDSEVPLQEDDRKHENRDTGNDIQEIHA